MNHAGHLREDTIVILNDNAMSISPNVGALSRNVNKLRVDPLYRNAKRAAASWSTSHWAAKCGRPPSA
jgi:1-deoxy-D-xylulose-5-phosphate synthase